VGWQDCSENGALWWVSRQVRQGTVTRTSSSFVPPEMSRGTLEADAKKDSGRTTRVFSASSYDSSPTCDSSLLGNDKLHTTQVVFA
jgi:hypothetical protein